MSNAIVRVRCHVCRGSGKCMDMRCTQCAGNGKVICEKATDVITTYRGNKLTSERTT